MCAPGLLRELVVLRVVNIHFPLREACRSFPAIFKTGIKCGRLRHLKKRQRCFFLTLPSIAWQRAPFQCQFLGFLPCRRGPSLPVRSHRRYFPQVCGRSGPRPVKKLALPMTESATRTACDSQSTGDPCKLGSACVVSHQLWERNSAVKWFSK